MAATAGTAAFGALDRMPARATTATPFLGSYQGVPGHTTNQWFTEIQQVVPGLRGIRQYDAKPYQDSMGVWHNNIATVWPTPPFPGCPIVFSIYPLPEKVIAGDTDTMNAIKKLMAATVNMPNTPTYLSAWHEYGNIPWSVPTSAGGLGFPGVTADNLYQVHQILVGIAALYPVTYGPILFAPNHHDYGSLVTAFTSCPPGMGFYGVDVYGNNGTVQGLCQLDDFIGLAKPLDRQTNKPQLLIAETNTPLSESFNYQVSPTSPSDTFEVLGSGVHINNGMPVFVVPMPGGPGFQPGLYYVLNYKAAAGTFQLSATPFGSPEPAGGNNFGGIITQPAPRDGDVGTGWFESVCARMNQYGPKFLGALTYWNVSGPLSGGWDPGPTTSAAPHGTTVKALDDCINLILPGAGAPYTLPPDNC